ncbi:aldehyde dehydrogenase family protein, partial [Acinetobacter baumannii]
MTHYQVHHYINGELHQSTQPRFADIFNPALGSVQGQVALGTEQDVNLAVAAAAKAFPAWANTPALARARVLMAYLNLLQQH